MPQKFPEIGNKPLANNLFEVKMRSRYASAVFRQTGRMWQYVTIYPLNIKDKVIYIKSTYFMNKSCYEIIFLYSILKFIILKGLCSLLSETFGDLNIGRVSITICYKCSLTKIQAPAYIFGVRLPNLGNQISDSYTNPKYRSVTLGHHAINIDLSSI